MRPALAQTYRLEENRAGLLPAILGCMEDWYTKRLGKAAFRVGDNTLSLLWTEGGVEYCIPVGFENALEYELDLGGNRFAVGVTGRFTANEDDEPVLKVTLCFLESSSSRLLKFVFRPDGGLTVKFDEAPGLLVAMRSLQGTMKPSLRGWICSRYRLSALSHPPRLLPRRAQRAAGGIACSRAGVTQSFPARSAAKAAFAFPNRPGQIFSPAGICCANRAGQARSRTHFAL